MARKLLRKLDQKYMESFEMWCWRRMEKESWTDRVSNEVVLHRVKEKRKILHTIRRRKPTGLGTFETMVFSYRTTLRDMPKDSNINTHCRQNLKAHIRVCSNLFWCSPLLEFDLQDFGLPLLKNIHFLI
jgi:hypothetical protein